MGTKRNPGKFDCFAKAEPDEPMFVLLGRDKGAEQRVRDWAHLYRKEHCADEKYREALACADAMRAWAYGERPEAGAEPTTFVVVPVVIKNEGVFQFKMHVGTVELPGHGEATMVGTLDYQNFEIYLGKKHATFCTTDLMQAAARLLVDTLNDGKGGTK